MALYLLAMDHRESFVTQVYGIHGYPNPAQIQSIVDGKRLIYRGLSVALSRGAAASSAGVLVDERYGEAVARAAQEAGITLAMPIEKSGQDWFTLEYGTLGSGVWMEHVEAFDPRYVKILVRDNPSFDVRARRGQMDDLATVSSALDAAGRELLLELLVPPTDGQESDRYDDDLRPELTVRVIGEMQAAGVEPAIWKIEGLNSVASAASVLETARQGGRNSVQCIVLGRDAPAADLDRWLRAAAPAGFLGFAIGRSIWAEPLKSYLAGDLTEESVVDRISANYLHFVGVYEGV
ncbi:2-deoxy-5-keto-D-gluconate 6-phosphate aldolase domain-containing protein [Asanoa iriomotensis]|uniref:DUF2090 domain-containing protein n=1 Tax=Asanoa iriomotensis TaxID=234613 RepID=A0ABQ4C8X3_9ACTN|nr:DUF2090 domain-containing protein [Asanoa iriomotensis]GIF59220.1 hypothetical protein Air01nite_53150 [Asanoa iriomotensis]